ncbi:MAG: type II toxin-antitoxin system RelE/ParE family toxin [Candidatus Melainabacteria bacterium]|nr:type II toxin-antitoxin system RelE/ParE family toxin [Candidatus Melainabacteria bacterium]
MIKSFRHRGLRHLFIKDDAKLLNHTQVKRINVLLDFLDAADRIQAMDVVGAHLHELRGDRKGIWSVRVSGNWRLTFRFQDGDAYDVNLEDYH